MNRLDRVWRRDALRALEALEKAPAQLEAEVRRQRLAGLQAELATPTQFKGRLNELLSQVAGGR